MTTTLPPPEPDTTTVAGTAEGSVEALGQIASAIERDYPWAERDHIDEILHARYERTHDAKVQSYRLVLAERETRAQLRRIQPKG